MTDELEISSAAVEFLTRNAEVIGAISDILVPTLGLVVALSVYAWNRKKDRLAYIQQSFDDLQSINELILNDKDNLKAAVSSIWPNEVIDQFEARKVYIHYLRINRLYRIWNYSEQRVVSKKQAKIVIRAHASVLKHHEEYLDVMLLLGYPQEFQNYLKGILKDLEPIPSLFCKIAGAGAVNNIEQGNDV